MIRTKRIFSKIVFDKFVAAIMLMVVLAYFFPAAGLAEHPVSLEEMANYGVVGIFFFYGLKLDFKKLKAGLSNRRLHLLIQLTTFVLFPLIALVLKPFFNGTSSAPLWIGIAYLCTLPSTVSTSVVMVSMANGNVPAAIFNASISSLIGVFITPILVNMLIHYGSGDFDQWSIVGKLMLPVLLPVVLGILFHKRLGSFAAHHKNALKNFDQAVILVIIYCSFCQSFATGIFKSLSWRQLGLLAAGMLGLFLLIMFLISFLSRTLGFNTEDRTTAMFCGSKKSLVQGTVMSKILFAGSSIAGIIILPLMIYHALQLIAATIIAQRMAAAQELRGAAHGTTK